MPALGYSYARMFEDAGWTGERLMDVKSDVPLEELGMYSEVDKTYLLLQLSRVRDYKRAERRRQRGLPPRSSKYHSRCLTAPEATFCCTRCIMHIKS